MPFLCPILNLYSFLLEYPTLFKASTMEEWSLYGPWKFGLGK